MNSSLAPALAGLALFCSLPLAAQTGGAVSLPAVTVNSTGVANQEPAGTFAMPASALTYEPRVDLQARSQPEGQADIAIRGGTFENTGIRLGALPLFDPQTGHYLAEIPVAPAMLGAPSILTGADNAVLGWNADAGTVAYAWRPIRSSGFVTAGGGQYGSEQGELYLGDVGEARIGGRRLAADVDVAHASSDGSVADGDSRFDRADVRLQLADSAAQTDLVYGYQAKFFGWPNLYTPFNSDETENLETVLLALNHRRQFAAGDFLEYGAYWRRNKDDYAFNRFAPVGAVHPYQHTTRTFGLSLDGRATAGDLALVYKAAVLHDDLRSTSLTFGRFHSRTYTTAGLFPEKRWTLDRTHAVVASAGASFDDTNHDGSAVSPVVTLAEERTAAAGGWERLYLSYAKATQVPTYTALDSSPSAGLFRGNPNLGREMSQNVELGGRGTWAGWRTDAAVFYRRDDHLVDWTFRSGVIARTANPVNLDTTGVELFGRRTFGRFDLVLGYTWLAKQADYGTAAVDASFYALNYPRHRLTAAITARLGAGWELRLDNDARIQAGNLLRTNRSDALLTSAGLYFRPPQARGLTFAIQVSNLWDSDFQEVPAVPAARRQTGASVTYAW